MLSDQLGDTFEALDDVSLRSSKFSFECLLLSPRSALEAVVFHLHRRPPQPRPIHPQKKDCSTMHGFGKRDPVTV